MKRKVTAAVCVLMLLLSACSSSSAAGDGTETSGVGAEEFRSIEESRSEDEFRSTEESRKADESQVTDEPREKDVLTVMETATPGETLEREEKDTMNTVSINVQIGSESFTISLYDNDAAAAFANMLPLTLDMSELNGNEKYFYLDSDLPAKAEPVGNIQEGDLMLYGSNCLVLFYDSFSTVYSYTRLGKADNPEGLSEALGRGSAAVTFQKK